MSRKTRAEAILICAIKASNTSIRSPLITPQFDEIGLSQAAWHLARSALLAVWATVPAPYNEHHVWAEAAAVLEDGWNIGDPLYYLGDKWQRNPGTLPN